MNLDSYVKGQLVHYLYYHCHHKDALVGLKAHAFVLRNRVMNGWGGWLDVLDLASRYEGNVKVTNPAPSGNDFLWIKLLSAIDSIFDGSEPSTVDGMAGTTAGLRHVSGLYIFDPEEPVTDWFKENILNQKESHKKIGSVGRLWVYS